MTLWRLIARGLWHHRAAHAAVGLGVALSAAVLVGSLAVGDSVEQSLRALARARLGQTEAVLETRGRWVRSALAEPIAASTGRAVAPVLALDAVAATPDGQRVVPGVRLYGVDSRFAGFFGEEASPAPGERRSGRTCSARSRPKASPMRWWSPPTARSPWRTRSAKGPASCSSRVRDRWRTDVAPPGHCYGPAAGARPAATKGAAPGSAAARSSTKS